ncbi:uncharacterized protein K489DRAFT_307419, partial [Dissoconium aciculare CBS 342.82]|uniref:SET domain-containing protein n=1 Tax=Dissoconium aciculare CBS 342.82 TaxID=1314786 RepID=A0A6J3LT91_9PEZI
DSMTDISFSVKATNAHDFSHASHSSSAHAAHHHHYDGPSTDDAQEDDTISCVCGYADDDGWTVQCDKCNRWQHQLCYYPTYEEKTLPDNIDHFCVDCVPRHVDVTYARRRQSQRREAQSLSLNGARRSVPKSHKKKKEVTATYTNGWPQEKSRNDRNSAGPRDQPPPAKRPKTTHRTSDSTTTTSTKGHSRKRNASSVNHRRSLSRSPETFPAQYSDEFLQAYVEDDWQVTDGNIHNIATMNTMVRWLNGPDDDFRKEIGYDKVEIYARWNGNLNDIPGKAEIEVVELPDDQVYYEGHQLVWKALTVKEPIAEGAYIGELKGQVELQSEYQQDPSNRWSNLKHPESFVFFHSKLPIVIDARQTGNELRYIRRSCTPNARLQILVTGGNEYHFCFMATQQIEPGVEITIAWDTHFSGLSAHQTQVDSEYLSRLSTWVSNVLANCGPCACQVPVGDCKMSRLDRRGKDIAEEAPSAKQPRSKKRRTNQHVSPINTNAVNSRSGSEARRVDNDEESVHSRSTSGSASRDITPNTHYSTNGLSSAAPELSERERKKLAKEEEMFRRQEEESSGKQAKKKRSSAGSNVNTPTAPSSAKQATFPASSSSSSRYTDAGTSRTPQSANTTSKVHARQKSRSSKVSSKPVTAVVKKPKPQYVDCSVQCDMDEEDAKARAATPLRKRNFMPLRQRLLERCARNNSLYNESRKSLSPPSASPVLDQMEIDSKHDERPLQSPTPGSATGLISPTSSTDESPIKSEADATHSSSPTKPDSPDPQALRSPPLNESNAPSRPRSKASTPIPSSRGGTPGPQTKHPSLHVSMPPP